MKQEETSCPKVLKSVILSFDPLLHRSFIPSLQGTSKDWHLECESQPKHIQATFTDLLLHMVSKACGNSGKTIYLSLLKRK